MEQKTTIWLTKKPPSLINGVEATQARRDGQGEKMNTTQKPNVTDEQKAKIEGLIQEFSMDEDIISFVNKTESGIKITQDNYGIYMAFLSPYADKPGALYIVSEALKLAGASFNGV